MRIAPKVATTTAPYAAERQSFPDNLIADWGVIRASIIEPALIYVEFESHSLRQPFMIFGHFRGVSLR
jgi:hypothetical protein